MNNDLNNKSIILPEDVAAYQDAYGAIKNNDFTGDIYKESFFIKRPVLSTVISIFIVLAGIMSIKVLAVEQYPNLIPPVVTINAQYPGATPETVAATVASPLEEQINGVEDMIYMSSVTSSTGTLAINVSFELGTDPDTATINVNNRVQAALTSLPEEVRQYGVTVVKGSSSILQFISLTSKGDFRDDIFLNNYALINIIDNLKRIKGVGDAQVLGGKDYSMRIWIKPERLEYYNLTPADVSLAIQQQNAQYAAGTIGSMPAPESLEMVWQLNAQGRLVSPEEFENIILRTNEEGGVLRLKDVADVELGAISYDMNSWKDGATMSPIAIYLAPGANALETATLVENEMSRLAELFPYGVEYAIPYDTTLFVRISIDEVIKTLIEAMVLVFLVVYLFLQNLKATLIPCIAVPISIVGTFAGMYLFDFTINTLTLFGLVLAIGIVVDDAIVVLENVERILATEVGITPRQATAKAMNEVTGPVIAIVLVLSSVFVPVAFLGGLAGEMYKQFAITISISVAISGAVALTLTPTLCVMLLKPHTHSHKPMRFFLWFNEFFDKITHGSTAIAKRFIRSSILSIGLFIVICAATLALFRSVPTELLPVEDQGNILTIVIGPDGTALGPTSKIIKTISSQILETPGVKNVVALAGINFINNAASSNTGALFIMFDDWSERAKMGFNLDKFMQDVFIMGMSQPGALVLPFMPPPIMGMSNTGGFEMYVQSQNNDAKELAAVTQAFVAKANALPQLTGVSSTFNVNAPRIFIELDRENAIALNVSISSIFATLASTFGTNYVNDFNYLGRTYKVIMQAESNARLHPEALESVYVRSAKGDMIPITTLIDVKFDSGPQAIERFNGFTAAKVTGNPNAGYSSGEALMALEDLAKQELPPGFTIAWTGSSYQEVVTGGTDFGVFGLSILMVLLILAAQYEKWTLPIAVVTAIPFAIFGAIFANWLIGVSNSTYTQVAIITLLGLASKNAILIVEFASELYKGGMSAAQAAAEASHLRFRAIVMTSLAFILGTVPLAIASGAGAASRQTIGVSVIGGMLAATIFAPIIVPYFFTKIMNLSERFSKDKKGARNESF